MIKVRYLEDRNVGGRLITKFILEIYSVKLWDGSAGSGEVPNDSIV